MQVQEVAAQLSQSLTSGQRSPSPKATLGSSSSFRLPQRGKAEAEGGGVSGKTDHGQKTHRWMSASIWAFVILNSGSLRVSHSLSHIDVLLLFFSFLHHVCYTFLFPQSKQTVVHQGFLVRGRCRLMWPRSVGEGSRAARRTGRRVTHCSSTSRSGLIAVEPIHRGLL